MVGGRLVAQDGDTVEVEEPEELGRVSEVGVSGEMLPAWDVET
jgi:hypothetical protein